MTDLRELSISRRGLLALGGGTLLAAAAGTPRIVRAADPIRIGIL